MAIALNKILKNLSIALAISSTAYATCSTKANAFQILPTVDGCQVWANDNGQQLYRKSMARMMLRMPCGNGVAANATAHYTSHLSGQSIIMNDIGEGMIYGYEWDGATGLVQTSRKIMGSAKRLHSQRN